MSRESIPPRYPRKLRNRESLSTQKTSALSRGNKSERAEKGVELRRKAGVTRAGVKGANEKKKKIAKDRQKPYREMGASGSTLPRECIGISKIR